MLALDGQGYTGRRAGIREGSGRTPSGDVVEAGGHDAARKRGENEVRLNLLMEVRTLNMTLTSDRSDLSHLRSLT